MIGMEDYSSGGLQDGTLAKVIILSVGPSAQGLEHFKQLQEHELKRAAALGTEPKDIAYSTKHYGLSVEYAVVEAGEEKVITGFGDSLKLPNYSHTGRINQLPLTEVFLKSKALHDTGKEFGYNFQKQGGGNSLTADGTPTIVNLHPNPNVEKDWDSGVSAKNVPDGQESKFADLLAKEKQRITKWGEVYDQWSGLTDENAEAEILQGLSRRMLLYIKDGKRISYVAPKAGMIFQAKVTRRADSKYFDLSFFEYEKATKKYKSFVASEKDASFVIDEETIAMAERIKELTELAREAYKAKQASVSPVAKPSSDDEWE